MKAKLLVLTLFFIQFVFSQNIAFTDDNLKNVLLNSNINFEPLGNGYFNNDFPPIDSNNDDEISFTEALAVQKINFAYAFINDLEGLQYFTNVKYLEFFGANFQSFNLPSLINLETLIVSNSFSNLVSTNFELGSNVNLKKLSISNNTPSLDLSSNINLVELSVFSTNLETLNLSNLTKLKRLTYLGKSPTIDLSDCVNLLSLVCYGNSETTYFPDENLLTSIDLSNQTKLVYLSIYGNKLQTIDLSSCTNLETVDLSNNDLTALNVSNSDYIKLLYCAGNNITSLDVNNLFNLQTLYCANNQLISLSTKNGIIEQYIDFSGNLDLNSVCSDENEVVYMQNQCYLNGNDEVVVTSNCDSSTSLATNAFDEEMSMKLYPNPASSSISISCKFKINKVEVFDMNGRIVMETSNSTLNIENIQKGLYFARVYSDNASQIMKFTKE